MNEDSDKVCTIIKTFKSTGTFVFEDFNRDTFTSSRTSDEEITSIIKEVYEKYAYVLDPHTACGFSETNDGPCIILATAHPAKFPDTIEKSIGVELLHPSLERFKTKPIVKYSVEPNPEAIKKFILEHL